MLLEMVSSPRSKPGGGGAGRHPGSLNPFHGGGPFDSWVLRSMSGACFKKRMSFPLFLLFPVFPSLLDSHTWSLTCLILCHPKKPCVPSRTGLPPGCCPFTCSFCSPPFYTTGQGLVMGFLRLWASPTHPAITNPVPHPIPLLLLPPSLLFPGPPLLCLSHDIQRGGPSCILNPLLTSLWTQTP